MRYIVRFGGAVLGFTILLSTASAWARPFRVSDIPNGDKKTCLNCHIDLKASAQTDFGSDALPFLIGSGAVSGKHVDWTPLCPLDSDKDGWTNGKELGDPDCVWKVGDPNPSGTVFNPGDPDSHPPPICGNGKLDAGEACEGDMMSDTDCMDQAAGEGVLGCTADCSFDYSQCSEPPGGATNPDDDLPSNDDGSCALSAGSRGDGAAALAIFFGLAFARSARRRRNGAPSIR